MAKQFSKREFERKTRGMPPYLAATVLVLEGQPTSVDQYPPEGLLPVDELDYVEQKRLCRLFDRFAAKHRRIGDAREFRRYCGLPTERPAYVSEKSWSEPASFESMWDFIDLMKGDTMLREQILDLYRAPDYTVSGIEVEPLAAERLGRYENEEISFEMWEVIYS